MDKTAKERMRRYRERNKTVTNGTENVTQSPDSVTESVTPNYPTLDTERILKPYYHPILYALTDPIKRQKLERICESLKRHNVLDKVFYGCGGHSIPFDEVGELLETTA